MAQSLPLQGPDEASCGLHLVQNQHDLRISLGSSVSVAVLARMQPRVRARLISRLLEIPIHAHTGETRLQ